MSVNLEDLSSKSNELFFKSPILFFPEYRELNTDDDLLTRVSEFDLMFFKLSETATVVVSYSVFNSPVFVIEEVEGPKF